ncbi:S ribonuclease [Pyrus ussuriensis x Pyrus communis]|uniref:S ribonuclease n=1 Tax=Pyrus ussuriensis x Pyrus communis TaxID=2448454 RepID=A0A5N5GM05_9ROSA|nr:S ribonuclease [Pyrus ussuriensis x Pyrus communis]
MSTSQQPAIITIVASSPDSPPVLPIMNSDHHHIIYVIENTTIILQIPSLRNGDALRKTPYERLHWNPKTATECTKVAYSF